MESIKRVTEIRNPGESNSRSRVKRITADDLARMFKCRTDELPPRIFSGIDRVNTTYRDANREELASHVLQVLKQVTSPGITRTREENLAAFEKGWADNLMSADGGVISMDSLKARYFRGSKLLRYDKKLIVADNHDLEYDLFTLVRYLLFERYLSAYEDIFELGCGSCQNLLMLSEMFPGKKLCGMDWASASIRIAKLLSSSQQRNITGILFDMLNPTANVVLSPGSAVFTIHALEQIGTQHDKLLSYIVAARPGIVWHYEPIVEFYDPDNLLDYLAILYSQKRNYLSGFWPALCRLQEQRKIEILEATRPYLGGVIHESSLIVWRPR